jgi:mannose-6-phosphate isomerase
VKLGPARLEPIFYPRPWGSLSLAPFFPERSNLSEPFGEAWMTGNESAFANGPFQGRTLGDCWPQMPLEWKGAHVAHERIFPLLVKFLFTDDKLSVQVHPDDAYAEIHEVAAGGRGKTEMWYAISARKGAEVLAGLKPGVTAESFERAIADATAEACLQPIVLSPGDSVFVPAGMPHAIGPGLVLCEIQQHSDLTYRVYDYDRRDAAGKTRPLHVEKALRVMRFDNQRGGKTQPEQSQQGALRVTRLATCRYFATEKWEFAQSIPQRTSGEYFELLIFIEGNGTIRWQDGSAEYARAQVWMLPAGLGAYELAPAASATSLLRTHVPGNAMKHEG